MGFSFAEAERNQGGTTPAPAPVYQPQQAPPSSREKPSSGGGTMGSKPVKTEKFDPTKTEEAKQLQATRNALKSLEGRYYGLDTDELNSLLKLDLADLKKCKTLAEVQDFLENKSRIMAVKASMDNGYAVLSEMKDMILTKRASVMGAQEYNDLQKTLEGQLAEVLSAPAKQAEAKINALVEQWEGEYDVTRSSVVKASRIPANMYPAQEWKGKMEWQDAHATGQTDGEILAGKQESFNNGILRANYYWRGKNGDLAVELYLEDPDTGDTKPMGAIGLRRDAVSKLADIGNEATPVTVQRAGAGWRITYPGKKGNQALELNDAQMRVLVGTMGMTLEDFKKDQSQWSSNVKAAAREVSTAAAQQGANAVPVMEDVNAPKPKKKNFLEKILEWFRVIIDVLLMYTGLNSLLKGVGLKSNKDKTADQTYADVMQMQSAIYSIDQAQKRLQGDLGKTNE